jgi:hypothetical protein
MSRVEEIHQEMFAVVQVQSDLSDTNDTAIVNATLRANAEQFEAIEHGVARVYRSLGLDAEGSELDDVVGQWPGFEPRLGQSPAQGAVLELFWDTSVGESEAPVETVVGTRSGKRYVLLAPAIRQDGSSTYPAAGQSYAYIASTQSGVAGNCDVGAINQVIRGPDGLIGCRNVRALTNGQDRESDAQLRKRAWDWLAGGINRMTPAALRAVAATFRSRGVRHASVWVDKARPYAEVFLDDGRGFEGLIAPAKPSGGTIPLNGQIDFWCEGPVVQDEVTLRVNGTPVPVAWTLIHERGRAWLDEDAEIWEPGDVWECSGHDVYIDVLRDFQALIEGIRTASGQDVGFRATGARIRARTALPEHVAYYVRRIVAPGFDADVVDGQIRATIDQFHVDLEQGHDALVFRLSPLLESIEGLEDCSLRDPDDPTVLLERMSPSSQRHKLTTNPSLITIVGF